MLYRLLLVCCVVFGAIGGVESRQAQAAGDQTLFLPLLQNAAGQSKSNPTHTGVATYYVEADGSGNCMFPATPSDLMVGAMNQTDYDNSNACGSFVEITGPNGVIVVRIVDRCPECQAGHIDLSPLAFSKIAEISKGRVDITWRVISPDIAGPIRYQFKDGSNQWWTAVQIRNHRNPIAKVEFRNSSGQYVALPRTSYNYFLADKGLGPGPYTFRVTDIYGNMLIDSGIPFKAEAEFAGGGQFPRGP